MYCLMFTHLHTFLITYFAALNQIYITLENENKFKYTESYLLTINFKGF